MNLFFAPPFFSRNAKSFSYKCHREPDKSNDCYSVNAVSFHTSKNLPNVYATVGSDGIAQLKKNFFLKKFNLNYTMLMKRMVLVLGQGCQEPLV